jgi:hypothetical protein
MAEVAFYSWQNLDTGQYQGLLRVNGQTLERADSAEGWVEDLELMRRIVDPGADGPDRVDHDVAEQLASRYGVALAQ